MATALYSQKKTIPGSHTTGADRLFWLLFLSKLTESVTCGISNSQTGMVNLKISRSAVCHFPTPLSWMHQKIQYLPVLSVSVWLPFDKFKIITKTGKTVSCLRRAAQCRKRERENHDLNFQTVCLLFITVLTSMRFLALKTSAISYMIMSSLVLPSPSKCTCWTTT